MAAAKKKTPLASLNLALLASVVAAGDNGMFLSVADSTPFTSHTPPLMEVNSDLKDAAGNLATRATDAGKAYSAEHPASEANAAAPVAKTKPVFKIVTAKLPEIKRGHSGAATSIYPFDDLPAATKNAEGEIIAPSFFIPATDERPDPAKKLASTVSSATRRWAVVGTPPKKIVQRVPEDAPEGSPKVPVEIDNMVPTRQFVIRAEEDGALWGDEYKGVKGAAVYRIDLGATA